MEDITDAEDGFNSHIDGTAFDIGISAVSQTCGFGYFCLGKPLSFADGVEFVANLDKSKISIMVPPELWK